MDINVLNNNLKQRASIIRLLCLLVAGLTISNIISILVLSKTVSHKDIVLIPAGFFKKSNITNSGVSASYIEQMSIMIANQRLNVTPDNIEQSNASILKYVNPSYYSSFKKQLDLDADAIKSGKIASSFYINDVQTNPVSMISVIKGTLKRWVGDREIGTSHKTYEIKFSKSGYQMLLNTFVEIRDKNKRLK